MSFRNVRPVIALSVLVLLKTLDASGSGFVDSSVNTPDSVSPSSIPGMQWESFLVRTGPVDERQWAEKVVGNPLDRAPGDTSPIETDFGLIFSVIVPTDWVINDKLTKIHTLHSGIAGPNYYRIYIKGDEYYFLSAEESYTAPIDFGVKQTFYVRGHLAYENSPVPGWIEVSIDEQLPSSPNPLSGQFVPRHEVRLHDGDVGPYLQIGLDTLGGGMPDGVQFRRLDWSLEYLIY